MTELYDASEAYGRLKEGVHIAGYTLERAFGQLERLIKGDDWRNVGGGFPDVNAFIASVRLDNFRLIAEQRKRFAKRIKELQPEASNRAIAKVLGVDESTVRVDVAGNPAPTTENINQSNNRIDTGAGNPAPSLGGAEAARIVARADAKLDAAAATERRREASRNAPPLPDGATLRIGDCRMMLADVADNSVPLILTDPPYGDEAEPLYQWLGEFAARVLIPGGSLICYTGQSRLDRDVAILSGRLRYWWLLVMPHDQSQRLPGKFVIANFKPVLWFVKDHRRGRSLVPDVLKSPAREKELHNWSQGDGGISPLIEHLTEPGELIVDPFAGTGKWGRMATIMGRRWLGSDIADGGTETVQVSEAVNA